MNQEHLGRAGHCTASTFRALANVGLGMAFAMAAVTAIADERSASMLDVLAGLLTVTIWGFGHLYWARWHRNGGREVRPYQQDEAVVVVLAAALRPEFTHVLTGRHAENVRRNGRPLLGIKQ